MHPTSFEVSEMDSDRCDLLCLNFSLILHTTTSVAFHVNNQLHYFSLLLDPYGGSLKKKTDTVLNSFKRQSRRLFVFIHTPGSLTGVCTVDITQLAKAEAIAS